MLEMGKFVDWNAWEEKQPGRALIEGSVAIKATSESPEFEFMIEVYGERDLGACHVLLKGRITPRPFEGLARYDIQDTVHENPDWSGGALIEPQIPHRHFYNERALRSEDNWGAIAEPLTLKKNSPNVLLGTFLKDLNISFSDSQTHNSMFDWVNK